MTYLISKKKIATSWLTFQKKKIILIVLILALVILPYQVPQSKKKDKKKLDRTSDCSQSHSQSLDEITPKLNPDLLDKQRKKETEKIKKKIIPYLEIYNPSQQFVETIDRFFDFIPKLADIEEKTVQEDFIQQILTLREAIIQEKKTTNNSLENMKNITVTDVIDRLNKKIWLSGSLLNPIVQKIFNKIFQKVKIFSDLFL